jgi:uncharacterized protein
MMQTMDFGLEVKEMKLSDGRMIEGYASLFGMIDHGNDVIEPGAYKASLARMGDTGRRVKMLWQHDPSEPIGVWSEIAEDERGLYVKGQLLTDVARAREAAALIEAGAIDGLSIGYKTIRATKDSSGTRHLSEVDLWEVSLVTFPMLPSARVGAIKADALEEYVEKLKAGDRLTEREFECLAKGLGLSNSQAERAARVHLKGQGEPANAVQSGDAFLRALLGHMA